MAQNHAAYSFADVLVLKRWIILADALASLRRREGRRLPGPGGPAGYRGQGTLVWEGALRGLFHLRCFYYRLHVASPVFSQGKPVLHCNHWCQAEHKHLGVQGRDLMMSYNQILNLP